MSERLSKRAQVLSEILRNINDGNYEKAGGTWSFGPVALLLSRGIKIKPFFLRCAVWFMTMLRVPLPFNEHPCQARPR